MTDALTDDDRELVWLGKELLAAGLTTPARLEKFAGLSRQRLAEIMGHVTALATAARAKRATEPPAPHPPPDEAMVADLAGWLLGFDLADRPMIEAAFGAHFPQRKLGELLHLAIALADQRRPAPPFTPGTL